jgi:RNA polymerase sigma-70 factor (ECF subfamily)
MTEQELLDNVKGCRAQDRQSQQRIFRNFYNYVMTIANRYVHNSTDAEEITSDTFFRAFSRIDTYNPDYSFKPWLGKVAVNCAINHFQKYNKKDVFFEELDNVQYVEYQEDTVAKLSYQELKAMIQNLPPAYKVVFNLYVIEGYKHEEIATMLNISEGTSKSNLSKARQKMQRMVEATF